MMGKEEFRNMSGFMIYLDLNDNPMVVVALPVVVRKVGLHCGFHGVIWWCAWQQTKRQQYWKVQGSGMRWRHNDTTSRIKWVMGHFSKHNNERPGRTTHLAHNMDSKINLWSPECNLDISQYRPWFGECIKNVCVMGTNIWPISNVCLPIFLGS